MKGDWHDEQCKKAMMKDIFHELFSSARLAFHCNLLMLFVFGDFVIICRCICSYIFQVILTDLLERCPAEQAAAAEARQRGEVCCICTLLYF